MEKTTTNPLDSRGFQPRSLLAPNATPRPRKRAPAIFSDPEELTTAFLHTTHEPITPQEIQMKYCLLVLSQDCITWKEFRSRVKKARKEEKKSKEMLISLKHLEVTAKALERAEKRRVT